MDKSEFVNSFGTLVEVKDKKFGTYISFVPNKLPPEIQLDKALFLALSKADSTLSKLSGAGMLLPNPDLLVTPYLKKEALSSSRIEGTRISLSEFLLGRNYKPVIFDAKTPPSNGIECYLGDITKKNSLKEMAT